MFSSLKKGIRVLYSTPMHPRVYGALVKRTANRSFWEVRSDLGECEVIHKDDIICLL